MRFGVWVNWIHIYSGRARSDIKKSLMTAVVKKALLSDDVALNRTEGYKNSMRSPPYVPAPNLLVVLCLMEHYGL